MTTLLAAMARARPGLSRAETRVAELVLREPEGVITMSMTELRERAGVSDPTIVRFCRRLGCGGYPEFKLRLAQDIAPRPPFLHRAIAETDTVAHASEKMLLNAINAIRRFGDDLEPDAIEAAADRLLAARHVFVVGLGLSETVAFDAEHKLFRLGLHCRLLSDMHRQELIGPTLRADEALLIFSQSGATRAIVDLAGAAGRRGALTVAVTAPGSRLARAADVAIVVPAYEHTELYTPLTSRLNHLMVVNMLVVAIGLRQGRPMPDNLAALEPWLTEKFLD